VKRDRDDRPMPRLPAAALVTALVLAAGCAQPQGDAAGPASAPVAADLPVEEWQEFEATVMASTHADCFVGWGPSAAGVLNAVLEVDERSKGERFQAYINVTDPVHVLFTRIEIQFEGADPTKWTFGGPPGELIEAELPEVDGPVKAWFDVCGTTGEVSVTYRAPLFDQAEEEDLEDQRTD
jgi:hypothetical protein